MAGCVKVDVTPYQTLAPVDVGSVEVFTQQLPDREFAEVGLIEVVGAAATSYGKLIARAREEAAKLGASGVIVSRRPIESAAALVTDGPLGPMVTASQGETPRIWAVAVVWR